MKYHVNDNGEVKRCRAEVKECKFGEASGKQHFDNVQEATAYAENINKKEFGTFKNIEENKSEKLDVAAEHYKVSRKIDEIIDYNNSNHKKDFDFKENDSSYKELSPKEKSAVLENLFNKEKELKEEYKNFDKSAREKTEYAPTQVDHAATEQQIKDDKKKQQPDSNNKTFKKYNETIELYKKLTINSKVDQEMSYMLEDIVGDNKDDMMSDDGIVEHLYEWQNSDDENQREAAKRLHEMLRN